MICRENGWIVVEFNDWTPAMMGLAYVLSKLPPRPDMRPEHLHSYPVGIERLRAVGGDEAVWSLYEVARELEFRPTHHEVVDLGKEVLRVEGRLRSIASTRPRVNRHKSSRRMRRGRKMIEGNPR